MNYTKQLNNQEQIELLNIIKSKLLNHQKHNYCVFLCNLYYEIHCWNGMLSEEINFYLQQQIPLFKIENAFQFGATIPHDKGKGWWKPTEYQNRLLFLNWIIDKLQNENNN